MTATPLPKEVDGHPRRIRLDWLKEAEVDIHKAQDAVERMAASPHLTAAGNLLAQARDRVADYLEGVPYVEPPVVRGAEIESAEWSRTGITSAAAKRINALGLPAQEGDGLGTVLLQILNELEVRAQVDKANEAMTWQKMSLHQPLADFVGRGAAVGVPVELGDDAVVVAFKAFDKLEADQAKAAGAGQPPEKRLYQTLAHSHGQDQDTMSRVGGVTADKEAAEAQGIKVLERPTVKEVFVVRVESAFTKRMEIDKVI